MQTAAEQKTLLDSDLALSRRQCQELQLKLTEMAQQFNMEHAEWLQLQKDLQIAVVVANDFRTEAQQSSHAVLSENESLRDQVTALTKELAVVRQHLAASGEWLLLLHNHCHKSEALVAITVQGMVDCLKGTGGCP